MERQPTAPAPERLTLDVAPGGQPAATLEDDVRAGLTGEVKRLPPKYFYDERGSKLFDAICHTEAYYPTRTEAALLEAVAGEVMAEVDPTHLVELGSGAARKTRILLEAMHAAEGPVTFVPMDVSASMLRTSAQALLADYPWLAIHGIVGDYEHTLPRMPAGARRLVAFLGGTIGNFEPDDAVAFLSKVRAHLHVGDALLLGTDLVKDKAILDRAYNDPEGLTAAFNKNLLTVLDRELGADFDPEAFEHRAFFDPAKARVEMHLVSKRAQTVHLEALDLQVPFAEGESIHTEVSRKFTRPSVTSMLEAAGFNVARFDTPTDDFFALTLARPA